MLNAELNELRSYIAFLLSSCLYELLCVYTELCLSTLSINALSQVKYFKMFCPGCVRYIRTTIATVA